MLSVKDLTVTYPNGTRAIDNLSFTVGDGESAALIGANGAGKTSLFLALVGILPFSGSVFADGFELTKNTADRFRQKVGLVFQNPDDQLFMPTIGDDVAFGLRCRGLAQDETECRVTAVLDELHISHLKDRAPLILSGGEKRTAAIASVLAMAPSVLLFDEPTAFLDPRARRNLIKLVNGLSQTRLTATHDLLFAAETADRAIILKDGRLFASGNAEEMLFDKKLMANAGLEAIGVYRRDY